MARSTHDYTIADRQYRTTALPATRALDLLPRLILALGPELLKLVLADDETIDKALADEDLRVGLLGLLAENAQAVPGGLGSVARDLLADTVIRDADGAWSELDVDEHFAGDLRLLFDVIVQATIGSFTRPLPVGSPSPSTPSTPA